MRKLAIIGRFSSKRVNVVSVDKTLCDNLSKDKSGQKV